MSVDAPRRRLAPNPLRVAMAWLANSMVPTAPRTTEPAGFRPPKRQYGKGSDVIPETLAELAPVEVVAEDPHADGGESS